MADAGEVACGTPELLWAAWSCANNKKVREKQVLSDEQRGGSSNLNVCTCALSWILHSSFLIPEKNPQVPQVPQEM